MRWRRAGWQLAAVIPIGLVFTIASFTGTIVALDNARPAHIGRSRPVVRGEAKRAAPLTTPLGVKNAAAWIGRVGRWERNGKSNSFHVYCTIAEIDGAEVEGLRLDGWSQRDGHFTMRTIPANDGFATIDLDSDFGNSDPRPSAEVERLCGRVSCPTDGQYEEAVVRIGDTLEVAGCKNGNRLEPCGDGADIVTTTSVRSRLDAATSNAGVAELFSSLFGGMGVLLLALTGLRARAMLDRGTERVR